MTSVTKRIKQIKQPKGGYIKTKEFRVIDIDDGVILYSDENIHSSLVGTVVDYMTRYSIGEALEVAFSVSLKGASLINENDYARELLGGITGLDDESIRNASKLVGYDVCYRAGIALYKPVQDIEPDSNTISNIKNMVNRSIKFIEKYGPITKSGFTFEGGYTELISTGDGDYLTETTLWDYKVSNKAPTSANTLQLLIYYLMGIHSIHKDFKTVRNLGIFNPRLNKVFMLKIDSIAIEVIEEVSSKVIGY